MTSIYIESRNRIHARNGEIEETTEEVISSRLLVYHIDCLALFYVLHARVDYVSCGNGFSSNIESNKSKCCPAQPGAWAPENAGTHAELLYTYIFQLRGRRHRGIDLIAYASRKTEDVRQLLL